MLFFSSRGRRGKEGAEEVWQWWEAVVEHGRGHLALVGGHRQHLVAASSLIPDSGLSF